MKLTPLDIKKHEFKKNFRGYDPVEVDSFLEMVSDEMLEMQNRLEELERQKVRMDTQLADYKNLEEKWKSTMISAQESAEKAVKNSRREADIIYREAQVKAEEIIGEARRNVGKFREELELLRTEKRSFIRRFRHLIQSQMELLEVLQREDIDDKTVKPEMTPEAPKA